MTVLHQHYAAILRCFTAIGVQSCYFEEIRVFQAGITP